MIETVANEHDGRKGSVVTTANKTAATDYGMGAERPSKRRQRVLSAYVADRLGREKQEWADAHGGSDRGFQAHVAKSTTFTPSHVSSAIRNLRGVGEDFADALARYWGVGGYIELARLASEWEEERLRRVEDGGVRHYAEREIAAKRARNRGVPDWAVEIVRRDPAYNTGMFNLRKALWWLEEIKQVAAEGIATERTDGLTPRDAEYVRNLIRQWNERYPPEPPQPKKKASSVPPAKPTTKRTGTHD